MNLALVAKQVWRIYESPNSLWAKVLKSLYFPDCSIWEAKRKAGASWGWQSLIQGRDFLNKHKAWKIKNGEKVKVYSDKWLRSGDRMWSSSSQDLSLTVNCLLKNEGTEWHERKISYMLSKENARKVFATPINHYLSQDAPFWPFTKEGSYSVKTGYHMAFNDTKGWAQPSSSATNSKSSLWKSIWGANVQPKIKNFVWRLVSNSLPTKQNLFKRKCGNDNICPVCYEAVESDFHLFSQCHWTRAVWFGSFLQLTPPHNHNGNLR